MRKKTVAVVTSALTVAAAGLVVALSACSQPSGDVQQISDLNYVDNSKNYFQFLDLYLPGQSDHKKSPLIVWIHGGAWRYGDKKDNPALFFAQHNYAVASLNYRLTDKARFPAQIQDCKAAIRWLRAHAQQYNLDPNKIGAFGMSAGGHLVAMLGVTNDDKQFDDVGGNQQSSSNVQAVCDWCGPTDMFTLQKQSKGHTRLNWEGKDAPLRHLLGEEPTKVPELAHRASPVDLVKAGAPPFLIMHGDKDEVVPILQSQELYDALKKVNADVKMVVVKDGEHSFSNPDTLKQALDFFNEKLK
jgi:acetyl esterase/lipase